MTAVKGGPANMKPFQLALISAGICALMAGTAGAGVYKWVDKDGKVRYSDRPPPEQAGAAQEVNRSAVPIALQERLRKMDPDFSIKRISGNLTSAAVCLEVKQHDRDVPQFVSAFEASNLGKIQKAADIYDGYAQEYDEQGQSMNRVKKVDDRCPQRRVTYETNTAFRVYEIKFDPKAVSAYREMPQ